MKIISCVTAGAGQVVRAVAEMLLASGFPAGRRERTCSSCEWGELWGPTEHRTLRLLLWSLPSSLGCHKHAEHALRGGSSVTSLTCCPGTSPCGSDHGRNMLCHHLEFLFPKRLLSAGQCPAVPPGVLVAFQGSARGFLVPDPCCSCNALGSYMASATTSGSQKAFISR